MNDDIDKTITRCVACDMLDLGFSDIIRQHDYKYIKSCIGKPYNMVTRHMLKYGGKVNSHGVIVEAFTKEESLRNSKHCSRAKI